MKIVAVFLFLAIATKLTHGANVNFEADLVSTFLSRSIVGDKIKAFLATVKEIMKTGDETIGIPKMDPFDWIHQEINVDDEMITIEGEVDDVHAEGLSNFNVDHADFKVSNKNLSIALSWPLLKGDTLFNITSAKIMDFIPVFGKGNATFEVENLRFATNMIFKLDKKNKKIELTSVANTKISLGKLKLDAKGLYNDEEYSEFMSQIISGIAPQAVVDFQEEIVTQVDSMIFQMGNELIKQIGFDTIWEVINPFPQQRFIL